MKRLALIALLAGCAAPNSVEPELPPEPVTGSITIRIDLSLPDHVRQDYFDSAYVRLFRGPKNDPESEVRVSITDTLVTVDHMPFGLYWAEFRQPTVNGWGSKTNDFTAGSSRYPCDWKRGTCRDVEPLGKARTEITFEHTPDYRTSLGGVAYFRYEEGGAAHSWEFDTGEIGRDATFAAGTTTIKNRDTGAVVVSGTVTGRYVYPALDMVWDFPGDACTVAGVVTHELRHDLLHGLRPDIRLRVRCQGTGLDWTEDW